MEKWLAIAMCIFGCTLLTAAMIIEPTGEIHSSILTAFGMCIGFSATLFGFKIKTDANSFSSKTSE